jgi:hypothetical protein
MEIANETSLNRVRAGVMIGIVVVAALAASTAAARLQ